MNNFKHILLLSLTILVTACATSAELDTQQIVNSEIRGIKQPETNVFASGQPTKEQLKLLSEAGVKNIVSLRADSEIDWDEGEYVRELGMEYHQIPVSGADGVTQENAALLQQTLQAIGDESLLVHCGSGNRVGALAAISEFNSNQQNLDSAISEGKRWGLNGHESTVRALFSEEETEANSAE